MAGGLSHGSEFSSAGAESRARLTDSIQARPRVFRTARTGLKALAFDTVHSNLQGLAAVFLNRVAGPSHRRRSFPRRALGRPAFGSVTRGVGPAEEAEWKGGIVRPNVDVRPSPTGKKLSHHPARGGRRRSERLHTGAMPCTSSLAENTERSSFCLCLPACLPRWRTTGPAHPRRLPAFPGDEWTGHGGVCLPACARAVGPPLEQPAVWPGHRSQASQQADGTDTRTQHRKTLSELIGAGLRSLRSLRLSWRH